MLQAGSLLRMLPPGTSAETWSMQVDGPCHEYERVLLKSSAVKVCTTAGSAQSGDAAAPQASSDNACALPARRRRCCPGAPRVARLGMPLVCTPLGRQ